MEVSVSDFTTGMADAIEDAFQSEWFTAKGTHLSDHGKDDRGILFSAIAQGVVKYLSDNVEDIFTVTDVSVTQSTPDLINSHVIGGGSSVEQNGEQNNKVVSTGTGKVVKALSDG